MMKIFNASVFAFNRTTGVASHRAQIYLAADKNSALGAAYSDWMLSKPVCAGWMHHNVAVVDITDLVKKLAMEENDEN
jgi:hypothetical protein